MISFIRNSAKRQSTMIENFSVVVTGHDGKGVDLRCFIL